MNPIDLHCHTTASDGTLDPLALYLRAQSRGVGTLAITDHDTVAACRLLQATTLPKGPRLIPGIELSTSWSGIEVHIVGLAFSLDNPDLDPIIQRQGQARHQRSLHIAERLARQLPDRPDAEALLQAVIDQAQSQPNPALAQQTGRPHFARWLVHQGRAKSEQDAFDKWLGRAKLGGLRAFWPPMSQAVAWIRAVQGTAVLAHPGKYRLTRTKLRALIKDFKLAGGHALEVASGNSPTSQVDQLASFCREFQLSASQGSDFHSPSNPWIELGRLPRLPAGLPCVWDHW